MRSILCLLVVCVFATTAIAEVGKVGAAARKPADAAQKKAANEKGNAAKANAAEQAAAEEELAGAILAAMDTDHDGIVTKLEYKDAFKALNKVHKDKQGNMTVPEKVATDPAAPGADAGLAQNQNGAGAPADRNNNEAMGRFMQMDTDHDGRLSRNEVPPQQQEALRPADTNRDGFIDAAELQAFSRRMGARMKGFTAGGNPNQAGGPGGGRKP